MPIKDDTIEHITIHTNQDIKVCRGCGKAKELKDFQRHNDRYEHSCKICQKREEVQKSLRLVTQKQIAEFDRTVSGIAKTINAPHISEALESLMLRFGGVNGFTKFYYEQVQAAALDEPGSKKVLDACKAITNMIEASTIHRASAPDVASLTDEQLKAEKALILLQMVSEDASNETLQMVMNFVSENSGVVIEGEQGTLTADS
jgi:hypothetical protein